MTTIATVALGTTSGATGRLGVRGQWTINTDERAGVAALCARQCLA